MAYDGPVVVEQSDQRTLIVTTADRAFAIAENGLAPPVVPLETELWLRMRSEISDPSVYPPPYRLSEFWPALRNPWARLPHYDPSLERWARYVLRPALSKERWERRGRS